MKRLMLILALVLATGVAQGATWNMQGDFATIQEAVNSDDVIDGDKIEVGPGSHSGALLTKSLEIKGEGGAVIDSGPMHPAGLSQGFRLLEGSGGSTISHLQFEVDLAVMNGDAVSDVTIDHCTFISAIQAVSNWRGNGWQISHNTITDLRTRNGGGIGILIADFSGGDVSDNVVSHNKISGTLYVDPGDGGGYNGTGIVIYADFRWQRLGAASISNNRIVKNKVSLVLYDTRLVGEPIDVVAFELSQAWGSTPPPDPEPIVIFDNVIGFNDWRGTAFQMDIWPAVLQDENLLSRNLGDNRGHGVHPSLIGPGEN